MWEQASDEAVKSLEKVNKDIEKSQDELVKYQEEVSKIGEKFVEMQQDVAKSLFEVNRSLAQLDQEKATNLGKRFAEVEARLKDLNAQTEKSAKDIDEINALQTERTQLIGATTEAQRQSAIADAKLTETQKILRDYEKEKLSIVERQTVLKNLQLTKFDEQSRELISGITDFKINDDFTAQYTDALGNVQKITDAKNVDFAIESLNKQTSLQQDLDAISRKEIAEIESLNRLQEQKTNLENAFNAVFQSNISSQKNAVQDLFTKWMDGANRTKTSVQQLVAEMRQALIVQQQLAASGP